MAEVLKQLGNLGDNSAIKIPLGDISAKTMRSAVFRATSKYGIEITSFSDQDYLYVVKQ